MPVLADSKLVGRERRVLARRVQAAALQRVREPRPELRLRGDTSDPDVCHDKTRNV